MLQHKVLIVELAAVDGLAAGAVVVGEVASLTHELRDDTVEAGAFEAEALLVRAQAAEILCERSKQTLTRRTLKAFKWHVQKISYNMHSRCDKCAVTLHVANQPAVMGTMSARSRKRILPAGLFPILTSMYT